MSDIQATAKRKEPLTDLAWEELLLRVRAKGKAMGITSEDDVERLSDEYRHEKAQAKNSI